MARWTCSSFFALGGLAQILSAPALLWWTLYLSAYAAGGWEPALAALRALRERTLDVDLLMIVAAIGAAAIGQVVDGALLIVIFATSGALEAFATARTADSVRALLDLAPDGAARLDDSGGETEVDTADLHIGDLIRIRPGERVGADAIVVDGAGDVDQATITGEPMPAAKLPGDELFAGTLIGTGTLVARVHLEAGESVIARIVVLVEQAPATKAETQLFIEKVEQRYSIGVVVLIDNRPAGVLALADRIRPAAAAAAAALTELNGRSPVLLTGDNAGAAAGLAAEAGISTVHAGLLPQDKVDQVRKLQADGARVLLVGDGVNDAPALAAADPGVAMGRRGSDLAPARCRRPRGLHRHRRPQRSEAPAQRCLAPCGCHWRQATPPTLRRRRRA